MTCSFLHPKTVNLTVFYSTITLNVPLYTSQLFTVPCATVGKKTKKKTAQLGCTQLVSSAG